MVVARTLRRRLWLTIVDVGVWDECEVVGLM
jgi:hypothetical protein